MSRVDRRALFTSGAAAALLAATGVSLDASPRRGGALRIAVARDGSFDAVFGRSVFDGLTEVGADGILKGELATKWTGSSDARTWRFDLREGVRFHDGTALTAEDVARSLSVSGIAGQVAVTGLLSLDVLLASGDPDLPFRLSDPHWVIRRLDNQTIGTGLYRVVDIRSGRHFVGERQTPHYKDGEAGWPDRIEVITIPDPKVRAEALRDGYVDVAALPEAGDLSDTQNLVFHPTREAAELVAHLGVGLPKTISTRASLDDGRIAERWWKV